jgi:hypothetical protein
MSGRQQRVMVQPIVGGVFLCFRPSSTRPLQNVIFKNLQTVCPGYSDSATPANFSTVQQSKISIWLYDNIEMRIEGRIIVCTVCFLQPRTSS